MGHFNLKTLTFYGVMIGSVLVLFNIVTTYGENSLKAPVNISGKYLLESPDLPDCLKSEKLVLAIAQSGLYLTGELSLASHKTDHNTDHNKVDDKTNNKAIKLNGMLVASNNPNQAPRQSLPFSLTGQTKQLGNCSPPQESSAQKIELQSQFQLPDKNLVGQMRWSSLDFKLTANRQNPPTVPE
jgi:hypothetical protein